jgi:hypothetical protein
VIIGIITVVQAYLLPGMIPVDEADGIDGRKAAIWPPFHW